MVFAEFFAGIGLMRLGLEKSGWKCAFANDIDPKKWEMYNAQFPASAEEFFLGDVQQVIAAQIPKVDLATASFPCTDLSLAGARAGLGGKQSSTVWRFLEILKGLELAMPKMVLLENVPALLSSRAGADFESVLLGLNRLGYGVDALILDAARFVPQSRPRLFMVGVQNPHFDSLSSPVKSILRPDQIVRFIGGSPHIKWNVRTIADPPQRSGQLIDILESHENSDPGWWSEKRSAHLLTQMSPRHRKLADAMIDGPVSSAGTVFRRVRNGRCMAELRTDGIAGCLRTPKGGSARQIVFFAGQGRYQVRLLSPRECARLMGAPDFPLTVSSTQALYGFGDAVCVPAIDWIARNYLNPCLAELGAN